MKIESKLWKVLSYNDVYVHVIQKVTGTITTLSRSSLPSTEKLAQMSEHQLNRVCRNACNPPNKDYT